MARPAPRRALNAEQRQEVLAILHSSRFVDAAPAEIYATLLDEGRYLCSERTMYRLLQQAGEVRERRDQLRRPHYRRPELLATAPNQVWSWDITKLRGPVKGTYYCLYVILDIFSRYTVGWLIAEHESEVLAQRLIAETIDKYDFVREQLTLHADRGSAMTSKSVAQLLADLGVIKSHSRPHTSDDNPYSEAQLKTLKYHPRFPHRFSSLADARGFCRSFFHWYNDEHHHSGLALLTPADVHSGQADQVLQRRAQTLDAAYLHHPERFNRPPQPKRPPQKAWINPPQDQDTETASLINPPPLSQRA
jgi:putative transposase